MNIEFEPIEYLQAWLKRFDSVPADVLVISDIPYSYNEIVRELIKRDRIEGIMEGLGL